ncbi:MAG: hypothetical protein ABJI69_13315 [Balneola sp.]
MYLILNKDGIGESGEGIIKYFRPSRIHYSQEKAENEVIRLKKKHPESGFIIFKAVSEIEFDGVVLKTINGECDE